MMLMMQMHLITNMGCYKQPGQATCVWPPGRCSLVRTEYLSEKNQFVNLGNQGEDKVKDKV
jgi:hypothetical protein